MWGFLFEKPLRAYKAKLSFDAISVIPCIVQDETLRNEIGVTVLA